MRINKLRIGIDVDDVLYECVKYAMERANEDYGINPPLEEREMRAWGPSGTRVDVIFKYFSDTNFYETQPIVEGAQEFIRKLSERAEVFFVTAVYPEAMTVRALRLIKDFPEVPKDHIIMGSRKDLIPLDIMLDDGGHNIENSKSTYPVLMRKPWNHHLTGGLAVNNFEEFLTVLDTIAPMAPVRHETFKDKKIYVLVGPSGSGKTKIIRNLEEIGFAKRAKSYTTRERRHGEEGDGYYYISEEEFQEMSEKKEFLESTRYAWNAYGTTYTEIDQILEKDENVVMAMDICGAMAVKNAYSDKAVLVFVDRPEAEVLRSIINRKTTTDEKVRRIQALDDEMKNESLCDVTFNNYHDLNSEEGKKELKRVFGCEA